MNTQAWLTQLQHQQSLLLDTVSRFSGDAYKTQFHPDLSPAGWHLGHCLFTENYWLREVVLGQEADDESLKALYVPELSPKGLRGGALPESDELHHWVSGRQQQNLELLAQLYEQAHGHDLLSEDYLLKFLSLHYAQHVETVMYVMTQWQLQQQPAFVAGTVLEACGLSRCSELIDPARYQIGREDQSCPYDNEVPSFELELKTCRIASQPVSNAAYLAFMQDGGYEKQEHWSETGWAWRQSCDVTHPECWQRDTAGHWYEVNEQGAANLTGDDPVRGISYFEAQALADWAGARLPHEYEWETAKKLGLLQASGEVWEWCENCFHPYEGFQAYPYAGYSQPYFDNKHFTLRGGSRHTQAIVDRTTFRNYYEADKRHQYAGVRLAFA